MPIRPENKHYYGKEWKTRIRPEILARASNCCELCDVPNHEWIIRDGYGNWHKAFKIIKNVAERLMRVEGWDKARAFRSQGAIMVVLTIAHLNHNPADNRPENLKALCQRCHNAYDGKHRAETRKRMRQAPPTSKQTKLF